MKQNQKSATVNVPEAVVKEARQVLSLIAIASERDPRVLHAAECAVERRLTQQPPLRLEDARSFVEEKVEELAAVVKSMDAYRSAEKRAEASAISG